MTPFVKYPIQEFYTCDFTKQNLPYRNLDHQRGPRPYSPICGSNTVDQLILGITIRIYYCLLWRINLAQFTIYCFLEINADSKKLEY